MARYRIVVADSRHADFFDLAEPGAPLDKLTTLPNPYYGRFNRDLGAGALGRTMRRTSLGIRRTSLEGRMPLKDQAGERFAKLLADHVARDVRANSFDGLVLIVAPRLLSQLKRQLPPSAREQVIAEVPQNLSDLPRLELQRKVEKIVRRPGPRALV